MSLEAAQEIQATLQTPGWRRIEAMLDEQSRESDSEFFEIAAQGNPKNILGTEALKYAITSKALKEFKQSVYDSLKILIPRPERK